VRTTAAPFSTEVPVLTTGFLWCTNACQFQYDHTTYSVELTVRLDHGAVNVYVGTSGLATPDMSATYEMRSPTEGVHNFWHAVIPYRILAGGSSVFITVEGRLGSDGVRETRFGRYKVLAQAIKFRSDSCRYAAVCQPYTSVVIYMFCIIA
jgi:hypothetical protein